MNQFIRNEILFPGVQLYLDELAHTLHRRCYQQMLNVVSIHLLGGPSPCNVIEVAGCFVLYEQQTAQVL